MTDTVEGMSLPAQQKRWRETVGSTGTWPGTGGRVDIQIVGPLDRERLGAALTTVAQRHDWLRDGESTERPLEAVTSAEAAGRHLLTVTVTQPVDLESLVVIGREIAFVYGGTALPGCIQYAQFDAWQRLAAAEADPDEAAWMLAQLPADCSVTGLANAPTELGVPDRVVDTYRFGRRRSGLLSAEGLALDLALLTAFGLVLGGRAGESTAVVGNAFSGRVFDELGSTVGLLGRVLPVAVAYREDASFSDCVAGVARSVDGIRNWLAEWGWPETGSTEARTRAQFEYVRLPDPILAGNAVFTVRGLACGYEPADLRLVALAGPDETTIQLLAGPEADAGFTEDLAAGLWAFLDELSGSATVAELPVLGGIERRRLLLSSDGFTPDPTPVVSRIRRSAAERPDAEAIVAGERILSYGELEAVTCRIATGLRRRGIASGTPVAIAADGSIEAHAAFLAALRAGAVAVPVDPADPAPLLGQVADRTGTASLIWQAADEPPDANVTGLRVLPWRELADEAPEPVEAWGEPAPASPAYLVLTAGSVGWPAGMVVSHGALANYLAWAQRQYRLRPGLVHAVDTPAASHLSVTAVLGALSTGGVFLAPPPEALAGERPPGGPAGRRVVDVLKTTPDQLGGTVAGNDGIAPRELLIVAGDSGDPPDGVLSPEMTELVAAGVTVSFEYSPPGAGVAVAARLVDATGPDNRAGWLPLGGNRLYVLDKRMRLTPAGVGGRVYIGGPDVAQGYAGDPVLTAKAFPPDPFGGADGARLYRTHGMGAWTPERELVLLTRTDDYVTTRGFHVDLGLIRAQLTAHPWVDDAVAMVRRGSQGSPVIEGYAVASEAAVREATNLTAGQASAWADVFDTFYAAPDVPVAELEADKTSWISSYTGEEMSWEELAESVNGFVGRVMALPTNDVLEIGFGTGLILYRLAPATRRYVATEISEHAMRRVRRGMAAMPDRFRNVELVSGEADDFTGWGDDTFDVVLLNSVAQYFPSTEYLLTVLREAIRVVRPGGHIVLGDVRDLALATVFHTSVVLARSPEDRDAPVVREMAARSLADESELLVSPELFEALPVVLAGIRDVQVELKRGRIRNELSKFRYDVIIGVGPVDSGDPVPPVELDWTAAGEPDAAEAPSVLSGDGPFVLRDVVDARLAGDVSAWEAVESGEPRSVADIRTTLATVADGAEPEDWWSLDSGFRIEVQPPRSGRLGRYDVGIARGHQPLPRRPVPAHDNLESYCSKPMRSKLSAMMAQELRRYLTERLPGYMIPERIVAVDSLSTVTGLDEHRPLPDRERLSGEYVAPRTPVEEKVAEIWQDILGVGQVGVTDDFFEIGGHSLLVVKVIYELSELFGISLQLSQFFMDPTVAGVSVHVTTLLLEGTGAE